MTTASDMTQAGGSARNRRARAAGLRPLAVGMMALLLAAAAGESRDAEARSSRSHHRKSSSSKKRGAKEKDTAPVVTPAAPPVAAPVAAPVPAPAPAPATVADEPEPPPAPLAVVEEPKPPEPVSPPPTEPGAGDTPQPLSGRALLGAGWTGVGITLALVTAGTVLGVLSQQRSDELGRVTSQRTDGLPPVFDASQQASLSALSSEGLTYSHATIACFVLGGVTAVTSGILFWEVSRVQSADKKLAVVPMLSPGYGGLVLGGRF